MQLLPIIIVVSILGLLLLVSLVVFAYYFWNVRARRKRPHMVQDSHGQTRQLTVRSGKVIPISEAFPTPSTREVRSLDVSTVRSGGSMRSKFSQDRNLHSPRTTVRSFDRRRSSAAADPEAQNEAAGTWEANLKELRHLNDRLRDPRFNFINHIGEAERKASISSQKIAASLKKAYTGTPALETETVELPPTIGSKSAEIRTIIRKKKSEPNVRRPSLVKASPDESDTSKLSPGLRKHQSSSRNASSSFQGTGYAGSSKAIQHPPPALLVSRHSAAHQTLNEHRTRTSFLSTSISSASSTQVHKTDSSAKAPPPSPVDAVTRQYTTQATTHDREPEPQQISDTRRTKPPEIDTNVSDFRETFFLDSEATSTVNAQGFQRDSMMSSSSLATFASSDLSSTWTFGHAQPIAILPGVMSRAATRSPSSRRPKSKYGRFTKPKREKELPILPRSPLLPISPISPLSPLSPLEQ